MGLFQPTYNWGAPSCEASLQCHVWKLRSSKKPFLRSKTPEERPSAQQAVRPVTCRCPGPWHPWHCRPYGTDGSGDAWRTRTWSLCLCGLLRASGRTENGKFCDQNWFPVTALWKRPAGRAVSSSGPGVLFLLTRSEKQCLRNSGNWKHTPWRIYRWF
jgi:hypothetical protein